MGRLHGDLEAAQRLAPFNSEALDRARKHFKQIKQESPGWQQAACDVVEIAHTQATGCAQQAGRDALLLAFAGKVDRLRSAAASSPQRTYDLVKMARTLDPALFNQDVVELLQLAPADMRASPEMRSLALDFSRFFTILEKEGANLILMQRLKPAGERYRALSDAAKLRAQQAELTPFRAVVIEKLTPYVEALEAQRIAEDAVRRLGDALPGEQNRYAIASEMDTWMWGQAVNARSKVRPVEQSDVEGLVTKFFDNAEAETKAFREAFESMLDEAFDAFGEESPDVQDFELLMDTMQQAASDMAEHIEVPAVSALQQQADEAWEALEERVLAASDKVGADATVKMIQDQVAHHARDARLPKDELHWQFHLRGQTCDRDIAASIERMIQAEVGHWKARFADAPVPDTDRLKERCKYKAGTARMVKQFEIIDAARVAADERARAAVLRPAATRPAASRPGTAQSSGSMNRPSARRQPRG